MPEKASLVSPELPAEGVHGTETGQNPSLQQLEARADAEALLTTSSSKKLGWDFHI